MHPNRLGNEALSRAIGRRGEVKACFDQAFKGSLHDPRTGESDKSRSHFVSISAADDLAVQIIYDHIASEADQHRQSIVAADEVQPYVGNNCAPLLQVPQIRVPILQRGKQLLPSDCEIAIGPLMIGKSSSALLEVFRSAGVSTR